MNPLATFATGTNIDSIATSLETNITPDALWGAILPFAGIVGTLVVFSFCYRVIKRIISGAGKGKGKV